MKLFFQSMKFIFILILAINAHANTSTPTVDSISYRIIKKTAKQPIDLALSHVEFFGTNKNTVEKLNRAVKEIWLDDTGCVLGGLDKVTLSRGGEYHRSLEVKKLTNKVVILKEAGDSSCPGAAHPNNGYKKDYVIDITSGKIIDLWKNLSEVNKNKLLTLISANGIKLRKSDPENNCRDRYKLEELQHTAINIFFNANKVSLEPEFSHAIQVCVETLSMPMDEFKKYFAGDTKMLEILISLK